MTITTIDKAACSQIAEAVSENLAEWVEEVGLTLTAKGGTYDPNTGKFTLKVEFSLPDTARREFGQLASVFGLKPSDYGRSFKANGKTFVVAGVKPRARTRPVVATNGGRSYTFAAEDVVRLLGATK